MADLHPFFRYTAEVLAWRLGRPEAPLLVPAPEAATTARRTARVCRHAVGRRGVMLVGLGSGHLAAALAEALPRDVALTVIGADPEAARDLIQHGQLAWLRPDGSRQLLADTSAMALYLLAARAGWTPDTALVTVNPETASPAEVPRLRLWRRLFTATRPAPMPPADRPAPPRPTLAVLARPDEPDLAGFFQALAGLVGRAVVLWDGDAVPAVAREAERLGVPVTHLARPLAADFAAQRNALLAACPDGWILGLDPDERPGPGFWEAVARVQALPGAGGAWFPRLTLHPRPGRIMVGHGLWPDPQLRLFLARGPHRPSYVRPVHERLEGLTGQVALALDAGLLHLNRRLADDATVRAKLAGFDAAARAPIHRLNPDYPSLPESFFLPPADLPPGGRVLLPPPLW